MRETLDLTPVIGKIEAITSECKKYIIGQDRLIELMIICLLSEGHMLIEGVPGIAKTLTARVLAKTIKTKFSRIQFTPDLMPSDILGTSVFHINEGKFSFSKGPIFSNLILIDEINRAPAKTQSALFEVMEEKQVSFDGKTYKMAHPFVVMATQNPIEQEGTYRLPEAQLDRFLMKIVLDYPTGNEEVEILQRYKNESITPDLTHVQPAITPKEIKDIQEILKHVQVEDQVLQYISQLVGETRNHAKVYLGASPRASLAILRTAKVSAIYRDRDFIIPDDVQYVAPHVLNHRLILTPNAEMEGLTPFDVITEIIKTVDVPR